MNKIYVPKFAIMAFAMSTMLVGCAGTSRSNEKTENSIDLQVVREGDDYLIRSPEPMNIYLPHNDWYSSEVFKDDNAQLVGFSHKSKKAEIWISTVTPQALKTDADPSAPDSVKMQSILEKRILEWDSTGNSKQITLSKDRGHACISDNSQNKCIFTVITKKGNWAITEVYTPKDMNAEELGTTTLSKVDNGKVSDYAKHPTRTFKSYGLGMSIWYNWEDKDVNPERDFSKAILFRKSGIIDFGGTVALSYINLFGFNYGDQWHNWGWRDILVVGPRFYGTNAFISPFFGFHMGLGTQYDDHYHDFADKFALSAAAHFEAGLVICRYCEYQFELGASYDAIDDGFFNDQVFGSFNFYGAVNY